MLFEVVRDLRPKRSKVYLVNLSGGIGVPYLPGQEPADISRIGAGVEQAFQDILVPEGLGHLAIMMSWAALCSLLTGI